MGETRLSIVDPIDNRELTREQARAPVGEPLRRDDLCEVCGARERFIGWDRCWECSLDSIVKLADGPGVLDHWGVIASHRGDFVKKSFVGAQVESSNGKLNLSGRAFKVCDFTGAMFKNVDFAACRFDKVDFTGARFSDCSFRKATFENCIVRFSVFGRSDFHRTRLTYLKIFRSLFKSNTTLSQCSVENARIRETHFENCSLVGTNFNGNCKISESRLLDCDLRKCDLTHVDLVPVKTANDALAIEGAGTNARGVRLTLAQGRRINFSQEVNLDDIAVTLAPTTWLSVREATGALIQSLLLRNVCLGLTYSLSPVLNAIAIGCLVGMVYCVVSGAFHKEETLMSSFLWSTGVASAFPLIAGVYVSVRLEKMRKARLLKP